MDKLIEVTESKSGARILVNIGSTDFISELEVGTLFIIGGNRVVSKESYDEVKKQIKGGL